MNEEARSPGPPGGRIPRSPKGIGAGEAGGDPSGPEPGLAGRGSRDVDPLWYKTLFEHPIWTEHRDEIGAARTELEADFIEREAALAPGAAILDLACGHGRHTIELASRGYKTTGQDLSPSSLAAAREASANAGLDIDFIESDMRTIELSDHFDLVINMLTAFGYLEDEDEDEKAIEQVAGALKPGGLFLIDTINPIWLFRNYRPHGIQHFEDGSIWLEEREYDVTDGRNRGIWTLLRADGTTQKTEHTLRTYTLPEYRRMLATAGLQFAKVWGSFDGEPYGFDTNRMIILSRKEA